MIKRIFIFALAILFMGSVVYAQTVTRDAHFVSEYINAIPLGGPGELTSPPQFTLKVRYGQSKPDAPLLVSGTAVKWDTTSDDGITVSACIAKTDAVCGILVTPLCTQDSGTLDRDDNWGEMAVGGYCLALIDITEATDGQVLCVTEQVSAAIGAGGYLGTQDLMSTRDWMSKDIGTLLQQGASDGLGRVWLNLN